MKKAVIKMKNGQEKNYDLDFDQDIGAWFNFVQIVFDKGEERVFELIPHADIESITISANVQEAAAYEAEAAVKKAAMDQMKQAAMAHIESAVA